MLVWSESRNENIVLHIFDFVLSHLLLETLLVLEPYEAVNSLDVLFVSHFLAVVEDATTILYLRAAPSRLLLVFFTILSSNRVLFHWFLYFLDISKVSYATISFEDRAGVLAVWHREVGLLHFKRRVIFIISVLFDELRYLHESASDIK